MSKYVIKKKKKKQYCFLKKDNKWHKINIILYIKYVIGINYFIVIYTSVIDTKNVPTDTLKNSYQQFNLSYIQ